MAKRAAKSFIFGYVVVTNPSRPALRTQIGGVYLTRQQARTHGRRLGIPNRIVRLSGEFVR